MQLIKPLYAAGLDLGKPITGVGTIQTNPNSNMVGSFISTIIGTLTVVAGLAFLVFFFLGAVKWISAGGDKGKVQEAQAEMINGIIGLIVVVVAYFIVGIVGGILGLDILNPMKVINSFILK